jgi:hypothetical protein
MTTERFIWESGRRRRKMHLAGYDRLGRFAGALCGIRHPFNRSCNLPLGSAVCKRCVSIETALAQKNTNSTDFGR